MLAFVVFVVLIETAATTNTVFSVLGSSNFIPCTKNARGILWYTTSDTVGRDGPECESISDYHSIDFFPTLQEIRQLVSQNLSKYFHHPTLACVGLSQQLWPKLKWVLNGSIANINQLSGQEYFLDNFGVKKLRIIVNYVFVNSFQSSFYECEIDTDETCKRKNQPAKYLEGNLVISKSTIPNKTNGSRYLLPKGRCQYVSGSFFGRKDVEENKLYIMKNFNFSMREELEKRLNDYFKWVLLSDVSKCYKTLTEFIFRYVFPSCSTNNTSNGIFVRPCREQCSIIQMLYCSDNWKKIEWHLSTFLKKEFSLDWLGCDHLPSLLDVNDEGPSCWSSIKKPWHPENINRACYHESDRHFLGRVTRTQYGVHCQRWDSPCPHFHNHWPEFYPELNNSKNFCRNPGGEKLKPWCYTMNKSQKWDYCSVPLCSTFVVPTLPAVGSVEAYITKPHSTSIIIAVLGFFGCFICVSVCYFYYRARSMSSTDPYADQGTYVDCDLVIPSGDTFTVDDDSIYASWNAETSDNLLYLNLKSLEFSRKNFKIIKNLANNFNRTVYEAEVQQSSVSSYMPPTVAVKELFKTALLSDIDNLKSEASALLNLNHENVVKLLAVCFVERPACLIFEFLEHGDMETYLRRCSSPTLNVDDAADYVNVTPKLVEYTLSATDLWSMAVQVAKGMEHVASLGYVHRDLAARNCLVGAGLKVKISDFEMCQRIHPTHTPYFVGTFDEPIGVRWTSPEIHRSRIFSTFSDVWAFGVVLWEMCTFGLLPYYGKSNGEVAQFVCDGHVLTKPEVASDDLFTLMMRCWNFKPEKRPTFSAIANFLCNELC